MRVTLTRDLHGSYSYAGETVVCRGWAKDLTWQSKTIAVDLSKEKLEGYTSLALCWTDEEFECREQFPFALGSDHHDDSFKELWIALRRVLQDSWLDEVWFKLVPAEKPVVKIGQLWHVGDESRANHRVIGIEEVLFGEGKLTYIKHRVTQPDPWICRTELGHFVHNWSFVSGPTG